MTVEGPEPAPPFRHRQWCGEDLGRESRALAGRELRATSQSRGRAERTHVATGASRGRRSIAIYRQARGRAPSAPDAPRALHTSRAYIRAHPVGIASCESRVKPSAPAAFPARASCCRLFFLSRAASTSCHYRCCEKVPRYWLDPVFFSSIWHNMSPSHGTVALAQHIPRPDLETSRERRRPWKIRSNSNRSISQFVIIILFAKIENIFSYSSSSQVVIASWERLYAHI
jgi:hypothetical protein